MPTFSEIRRKAENLISQSGVTGIYPVPLERIANHLGFASLAFDGGKDISGAIQYDSKTIYINQNESSHRQRFTLAHEIGHAVLHANENIIDLRSNIEAPPTPKEKEANHFAANLLMPERDFQRVWNTRLGDVKRVAAYFGVSESAANFRYRNVCVSEFA